MVGSALIIGLALDNIRTLAMPWLSGPPVTLLAAVRRRTRSAKSKPDLETAIAMRPQTAPQHPMTTRIVYPWGLPRGKDECLSGWRIERRFRCRPTRQRKLSGALLGRTAGPSSHDGDDPLLVEINLAKAAASRPPYTYRKDIAYHRPGAIKFMAPVGLASLNTR